MACIAHFDRGGQPHDYITNPHSAAERSARAAQKFAALGEMTGGIAHDVRNILAAIESGLRIAERANEREKLRVGIAATREGIDRGTKLIAQLLNFAKQQEPGLQPDDTNELLKTLGVFLQCAAGPGIRIVFKLASDIRECAVDRSQFGAALLNLVVNARDRVRAWACRRAARSCRGSAAISRSLVNRESAAVELLFPASYYRHLIDPSARIHPWKS